jgi:hypothetical protein
VEALVTHQRTTCMQRSFVRETLFEGCEPRSQTVVTVDRRFLNVWEIADDAQKCGNTCFCVGIMVLLPRCVQTGVYSCFRRSVGMGRALLVENPFISKGILRDLSRKGLSERTYVFCGICPLYPFSLVKTPPLLPQSLCLSLLAHSASPTNQTREKSLESAL